MSALVAWYFSLPARERLAIAAGAGFLDNEYEDTLPAGERDPAPAPAVDLDAVEATT